MPGGLAEGLELNKGRVHSRIILTICDAMSRDQFELQSQAMS
jgi:hypothetical protein